MPLASSETGGGACVLLDIAGRSTTLVLAKTEIDFSAGLAFLPRYFREFGGTRRALKGF